MGWRAARRALQVRRRCRRSPLRTRRPCNPRRLISLRVDVLRERRALLQRHAIGLTGAEELQASLDMNVGRVQFRRPLISVERIVDLIVT